MKKTLYGVVAMAIVVALWGASAGNVLAAADDEAAKPQFYTAKVQPILQANCFRCHGGMNHRGSLSLATRTGVMKGGRDGAVVVPGDPSASLLVKLIRHEGPAKDPGPMPPKSKLSDADIATVERWIRAGAVMPDDVPPR